jgi:hypothetical protein
MSNSCIVETPSAKLFTLAKKRHSNERLQIQREPVCVGGRLSPLSR